MNLVDTPIDLLVFSVQGLVLGAYAGHVEEILTTEKWWAEAEGMKFTFRYREKEGPGIHLRRWLEQQERRFSHQFPGDTLYPSSVATILVVNPLHSSYWGVSIDEVKDLLTLSREQIHLLPTLMQKIGGIPAVWGMAQTPQRLIPLIDLTVLM